MSCSNNVFDVGNDTFVHFNVSASEESEVVPEVSGVLSFLYIILFKALGSCSNWY